MTGWSSLGRLLKESKLFERAVSKISKNNDVIQRGMSGHGPARMEIEGSRWQWHKFKDLFHFYFMLGVGWTGLIITYSNVFVGPAQLAPIPEGYEPKHWEYYRSPISRFIARYFHAPPQQDYEKYLHLLSEVKERQWWRQAATAVREAENVRKDIKGPSYHYVPADHVRLTVDEINEQLHHRTAVQNEPY